MNYLSLLNKIKASIIVQLILSYVLITSSLIVNSLQLISLLTWPISKTFYRKVNYFLSYVFYAPYAATAQWWSGSVCEIFIKKENLKYFNKENSVVIMNHKYDVGEFNLGHFF